MSLMMDDTYLEALAAALRGRLVATKEDSASF
jgi:hypothetical protein